MTTAGHERIEAIAVRLEDAGLPGFLWDPAWRLVWVSSAVKALLGEGDNRLVGIGQHFLTVRTLPAWDVLTPESSRHWLAEHVSLMLAVAGGDVERVLADVREVVADPGDRAEVEAMIEAAGAGPWPSLPVRASTAEFSRWGRFAYVTAVLREADGAPIGTLSVAAPDVPATLLVLLIRGEREMFDRMARLQEPSRREAAILFADLEASGPLSRHLPSASYFGLIRALTSGIDATVARAGGVVGKHAGDGASAFFLADELGGASRAAAATIEAARSLSRLGHDTARAVGLDPSAVALNIGVHWGGTPFMGQLTGGRLEVTALGDEVNECARVQESAHAGTVLVTKDLLERLDEADARRLGIDPAGVSYTTLSELEGVSEKAIRDAGALSVTTLHADAGST